MIKLEEELKKGISRRAFNAGALAAAATLAGCGGGGESDTIVIGGTGGGETGEPEVDVERVYGSGGHNCGGRCVTVAEVSNGRVLRILTDENKFTFDGTYLDPASRNFPQTRACSRCRSYKYRLYHPGRLRYPLKQTKKRGDLSGFTRISWEQALSEIAKKHDAVLKEYDVDGIYQIYACGSVSSQLNGAQSGPIGKSNGYAMKAMGGVATPMFGSYSTHQNTYFNVGYTGMDGNVTNCNNIARYTKNLVLWGDNSMSTGNPSAYVTAKAVEDMKNRDKDAKVYYIGPEFSDTAVTSADQWIVSKPYTDPALVAAMLYHMLDNTFDLATGELKANPWLDVDYLDTMVYGFFDSPKYWINTTGAGGGVPGEITLADPSDAANWREVREVPSGRSYCSWILGNNTNAKTYSQLGASTNYTANKYGAVQRWAPCSYPVAQGANTKYFTKLDYRLPKTPTPGWASAITGVPEQTIKDLAELFAKKGPVMSRWSGGQQKQADGITNLYIVQALHIITKNVGDRGAGFTWGPFTSATFDTSSAGTIDANYTPNFTTKQKPSASCTAWHTAIKMAFGTVLKNAGYRAQYIPNWPDANNGNLTDGMSYWDDGGTKAFIQWRRTGTGIDSDASGFIPVRDGGGNVKYAGIRLLYNAGGNIFMNQHENTNDSREMLEYLPLSDDTADTFCLVSIDNFMSATPRWSDYVLPGTTFWEQQDVHTPTGHTPYYARAVSTPPGEAKPLWDIGIELAKNYELVSGNSINWNTYFYEGGAKTVEGVIRERFKRAGQTGLGPYNSPSSPFYRLGYYYYINDPYGVGYSTLPGYNKPGTSSPYTEAEYYDDTNSSPLSKMTWDEYKKNPFVPVKPDDFTIHEPVRRKVMENYKAHVDGGNLLTSPFIKNTADFYVPTNPYNLGGYGNDYLAATIATAPQPSLRFQVYSPILVWQYEHKFEKWHSYLTDKGQLNEDFERDPRVIEIPVYYDYRDYFVEAYGGFQKYPANPPQVIADLPFTLTTTHNRYRSHSSLSENPMLRELSHRVPGLDKTGKFKQGNDCNYYAALSAQSPAVNETKEIPPLNFTINADGTVNPEFKEIASYSEILIHPADAASLNPPVMDGDLVQVENPVGAVRCVAKLTRRCAKGFVGLHQGCWYDPRMIDGKVVDVGGCCNTLMASQPSRIDHGNGQQSALVKIFKVN